MPAASACHRAMHAVEDSAASKYSRYIGTVGINGMAPSPAFLLPQVMIKRR